MKFWKMNGAGNDFIMLNNLVEKIPEDQFPALARLLCERHLSIGADALMAVDAPSEGSPADVRMRFYNSDGSIGEMCGNGARCICRYVYENGLQKGSDPNLQIIETTAGIVTGERISSRQYRIRLNDPSVLMTDRVLKLRMSELPFLVEGRAFLFTEGGEFSIPCGYVELGRPGIPHLMVAYEGAAAALCQGAKKDASPHLCDADEGRLRELGRMLRHHPDLPKGANVNFYELTGPNEVFLRTFERGVEDFTYACGTGTGSLAAVLFAEGKVSREAIRISMTGGLLQVDIKSTSEETPKEAAADAYDIGGLYLTGPTNIVARGEITDEELPELS